MTYPHQPVQRIVSDSEPFRYFDAYLTSKESKDLWEVVRRINGPPYPNPNLVRYPWLTPVLGSGCRQAVPANVVDSTGEAVQNRLAEIGHFQSMNPLSLPAAEFAGLYTRKLVADRLDIDVGASRDQEDELVGDGVKVGLIGAQLCLAAALVTTLLHRLLALQPAPHMRSGLETVTISKQSVDEADDIVHLIESVHIVAESTRESLSEENHRADRWDRSFARAIPKVLDDLQGGLRSDPVKVDGAHVQAAAELAWLQLSDGIAGLRYPGWGDLLQALSITADSSRANRPLYSEIGSAQEDIRHRYLDTTLDRLSESAPSVHDEVATILDLQSSLLGLASAAKNKAMVLPTASAFVTSFDLELEMALWQKRKEQKSQDGAVFMVALPVHAVLMDGPRESYPVWLGCVIRPRSGKPEDVVASLTGYCRQPDGWQRVGIERDSRQWFVVSGTSIGEMLQRAGLGGSATPPIVIRLSGSPLMALPPTGQADLLEQLFQVYPRLRARIDNARLENPDVDDLPLEFRHAVLLSEYDALAQNAAELFNDNQNRYGLPPMLSGSERGRSQRFWLMMGVQMADVGIRSRLASQISSPRYLTDAGVARGFDGSWRAGLVVNQRIGDVEQDLFYWNGFDVVAANMAQLTESLQEFADKMREAEADLRRMVEDAENAARQRAAHESSTVGAS